jgi:hypothetical protein
MKNLFFENLDCLIVRDFWMVKVWPYFQFFCPKSISFENFRWGIISLDVVSFPFRTSKLKINISYIKYKFSHRFGKVCKWLNMYYSKIRIILFFIVITMSIWIILKNLVWIYRELLFAIIEPLYHAFTHFSIFAKDVKFFHWVKDILCNRFFMIDLWEVEFILRLQVTKDKNQRNIMMG